MRKLITRLKYATHIGSPLSMRLVALSGKYSYPMHPKHLVGATPWFLRCIKSHDAVLDLGCGNGQLTLTVAKHTAHITGLDKNPAQLAYARKEAVRKGVKNAVFMKYDIERKLPFSNESFNVVILQDILEHVRDDTKLLKNSYRVLRPKGTLILAVPNSDTSWKREQRKAGYSGFSDKDHKREYTQAAIRSLLAPSGFQIEFLASAVYDTWLAGLIDLVGGVSLTLYRKLSQWKKRKLERYPEETTGWRIVAVKP